VFYGRPTKVIILYNQPFHCDVNGECCHGKNENTINDPHLNVAPYLSDECKTYIESILLMGVTVDMVYDKYIEDPSNVGISSRRDEYMTRKDVVNAWKRVHCRRSQKHFDDAMSVNLWHAEERDIFFYYQRPNGTTVPFIMGLQTPWMCERMVQHSHNSIISMDSKFCYQQIWR
ncbi:hypothetical protein KI387_030836, partial [Taxus chinensis]